MHVLANCETCHALIIVCRPTGSYGNSKCSIPIKGANRHQPSFWNCNSGLLSNWPIKEVIDPSSLPS